MMNSFAPTILLIRPVRFQFNDQTAVNNAFQVQPTDVGSATNQTDTQVRAQNEFDNLVKVLKDHQIHIMIIEDTPVPHTPDSIFPNNWISFHEDGTIVLYPMFAENRRLERKNTVLEAIRQTFSVSQILDLSHYEQQSVFLEGTGSFVLDRGHNRAYACISPRTDRGVFQEFCHRLGYKPIIFDAFDKDGVPIYHTNVMMCIADRYAIINLECIATEQREYVLNELINTGKTIVEISNFQMESFAGNMLQVFNKNGKSFLVMSSRAFHSLDPKQLVILEGLDPIIHSSLETIENNGGGSARCMMAEVYLDPK